MDVLVTYDDNGNVTAEGPDGPLTVIAVNINELGHNFAADIALRDTIGATGLVGVEATRIRDHINEIWGQQ